MILSSTDIKRLLSEGRLKIDPLSSDTVRENGVDLRFSGEVASPKNDVDVFIPGESDPNDYYVFLEGEEYTLDKGSMILISTLEYVALPDDVVGLVGIRSSYARLGIYTAPTVVDAGYEGRLTITLYSTSFPVRLRRGDRIIHMTLYRAENPSDSPYRGVYKGVSGIALPFSKRSR